MKVLPLRDDWVKAVDNNIKEYAKVFKEAAELKGAIIFYREGGAVCL